MINRDKKKIQGRVDVFVVKIYVKWHSRFRCFVYAAHVQPQPTSSEQGVIRMQTNLTLDNAGFFQLVLFPLLLLL